MGVDFCLSEERLAIRDSVRRWCSHEYSLLQREVILSSAQAYSAKHWAAFGAMGWLGLSMPQEVGGSGADVMEIAVLMEEFGRALVAEPYLGCVLLAGTAVAIAADSGQRRELLEPMIAGRSLIALAHAEAHAATLPFDVRTRAHKRGVAGYLLSGRKSLVLGAANAQFLIVSARTAGDLEGRTGISLFVVDANAAGLSRRDYRLIDGTPASDVTFCDVEVSDRSMLGTEGNASAALARAVQVAIIGACAEAIGAMEGAIFATRDYLKARRAYGTTLSTLQALQHRMADMLLELEMSRSILDCALQEMGCGRSAERDCAISGAKALVGESSRFVGANCIQLHGAQGMAESYVIGQYFKRLAVIDGLFGNSDFHLWQYACKACGPPGESPLPQTAGVADLSRE